MNDPSAKKRANATCTSKSSLGGVVQCKHAAEGYGIVVLESIRSAMFGALVDLDLHGARWVAGW
jgi:hypothetical protein